MSVCKKSVWLGASTLMLASSIASAQAPAARATGAFEEIKAVAPSTDETTLKLQTGGNFAAGNTQSVAVNAAMRFVLRRGRHQLTIDAGANYGVAWNVPAAPYMTTMPTRDQTTIQENFLIKGRYDIFLTANDAIFFAPQAFRDRLAGFNSRLSFQLGYLRNWVNVPDKRKFWTEIGADLNYENTATPAPGQTTNERFIGAARLFLGFEEKSNKAFNFNIGVEGLLDVTRPSNFRINGTAGISSKLIDDALSIGFTVTGRYVNEPIPLQAADTTMMLPLVERERFDLTSLITVVYTYTPPKPPPTPPAPAPAPAATTPPANTTTPAPAATTTTPPASTTTPPATTTTTPPASTTTPAASATTTTPAPASTTTTTPAPATR